MCVCVCVCVHARACVCVCECVEKWKHGHHLIHKRTYFMIQEAVESTIEHAFISSIIITQVKSWVWPLALHFISRPPKKDLGGCHGAHRHCDGDYCCNLRGVYQYFRGMNCLCLPPFRATHCCNAEDYSLNSLLWCPRGSYSWQHCGHWWLSYSWLTVWTLLT